MSVIQGRDAAYTMSGVGNLSVVNEISVNDSRVFVDSMPEQQEKPEISHRILVVEDDTSLAHMEALFLTAHNFIVVISSSAEVAITSLDDFMPDLVVLDLELAGSLSGWDVLQALRKNAAIPVLITTSLPLDLRKYSRTHGETRSTLDHLAKPYQMQALLKCIKRMLMIAPQ
jgi:DNA-binding response OmpR family regulator